MFRFAILFHDCPEDDPRPSHWDLLLEEGESLRAWALSSPPILRETVEAFALPDHRPKYLDYEGPVSNGRGSVSRWDHGTYRSVQEDDSTLIVELDGERISGRIVLVRETNDLQRWSLTWSSR